MPMLVSGRLTSPFSTPMGVQGQFLGLSKGPLKLGLSQGAALVLWCCGVGISALVGLFMAETPSPPELSLKP